MMLCLALDVATGRAGVEEVFSATGEPTDSWGMDVHDQAACVVGYAWLVHRIVVAQIASQLATTGHISSSRTRTGLGSCTFWNSRHR